MVDAIPPVLPTDSEDVVWALQTADSLWRRGERADAIVWLRRAAQAAVDVDDAKRAASLARMAAELTDSLLDEADEPPERVGRAPIMPAESLAPVSDERAPPIVANEHGMTSLDRRRLDADDDDAPTPVRHVAASPMAQRAAARVPTAAQKHAGLLDPWSGDPDRSDVRRAPSAGPRFDEEEVITSAKRVAQQAARRRPSIPDDDEADTTTYRQINPRSSRPEITPDRPSRPSRPDRGERVSRPYDPREEPDSEAEPLSSSAFETVEPRPRPAPAPTIARSVPPPVPTKPPLATKPPTPSRAPAPPLPPKAPSVRPQPISAPPATDLLELVDAVVAPLADEPPSIELAPPTPIAPVPSSAPPPTLTGTPTAPAETTTMNAPAEPATITRVPSSAPTAPPPTKASDERPSTVPTPRPPPHYSLIPVSARPTAPPPSHLPEGALPSAPPTRPRLGPALIDLSGVEALGNAPDEVRDALAAGAVTRSVAEGEELAPCALVLVLEGALDVTSASGVAAARLEKDDVLRARATIEPGIATRLVGGAEKTLVATWDAPALDAALRACPWVDDDLRAAADHVQTRVGLALGPLGARFDIALRETLASKLTARAIAPGDVVVAQGRPVGIVIVAVGVVVLLKGAQRVATLGPGDFLFPQQVVSHGVATATAAAAASGAIVLAGDRTTAQSLVMEMPPLLELLVTL